MYDYQASECKYFPLDDVRISLKGKTGLSRSKRENAGMPVFIGYFAFARSPNSLAPCLL
jgi:hypothetical protein